MEQLEKLDEARLSAVVGMYAKKCHHKYWHDQTLLYTYEPHDGKKHDGHTHALVDTRTSISVMSSQGRKTLGKPIFSPTNLTS